jgi:hypothetical protein
MTLTTAARARPPIDCSIDAKTLTRRPPRFTYIWIAPWSMPIACRRHRRRQLTERFTDMPATLLVGQIVSVAYFVHLVYFVFFVSVVSVVPPATTPARRLYESPGEIYCIVR